MERLSTASAGFWPELVRAARQAAVWLALPLAVVAVAPVMIVLLGELAAMDLPVRGLRDGFAAFCVAGTACCAAITLRRCLERRPAWGSDAIVAALVAGLLVSRGAAGRIPLPELLLAGYCAGALLFDVGATWRRTRFAGARAMDGHPGKVSYKVR